MKFLENLSNTIQRIGDIASEFGSNFARVQSSANELKTKKVFSAVSKTDRSVTQTTAKSTRIQIKPDPTQKIPVVYGDATLGGIITDAALDPSDESVLWVCFTLCEKTGILLSSKTDDGQGGFTYDDSEINLVKTLMNGFELVYSGNPVDGYTALYLQDYYGNQDPSVANNITLWFYNNGTVNANPDPYKIFPNWHSYYNFNNLVFTIVRINYDPENDITDIPDLQFQLRNTLTKPGDVLYDYMTNTRYGAGIPAEEVYVE